MYYEELNEEDIPFEEMSIEELRAEVAVWKIELRRAKRKVSQGKMTRDNQDYRRIVEGNLRELKSALIAKTVSLEPFMSIDMKTLSEKQRNLIKLAYVEIFTTLRSYSRRSKRLKKLENQRGDHPNKNYRIFMRAYFIIYLNAILKGQEEPELKNSHKERIKWNLVWEILIRLKEKGLYFDSDVDLSLFTINQRETKNKIIQKDDSNIESIRFNEVFSFLSGNRKIDCYKLSLYLQNFKKEAISEKWEILNTLMWSQIQILNKQICGLVEE